MFGYTAERRIERQHDRRLRALLDEIAQRLTPANHATAVSLAALADEIKGFGHVKLANYEAAKKRQSALLQRFRDPIATQTQIAAE